MSNKIGRFELLSEIYHSDRGAVYKASDPESGKTVALKTLRLETLGEQGPSLVEALLQEAETSKALNSPNIALLYGAGEIDGLICAELEYVQGNSVATMLARKEGFSIWDLMDITRQTCQGLDHAHAKNVFHHTLEPAKIMVTWDGTVKVLGFGISTMGVYATQVGGPAPEVLHYMPPEQFAGDPLDARSNIFSLGAILYEMVTERKAFDGDDAETVRQAIHEMSPVAPDQVNRKIHPALSEVIMKALAKNPEARYASGQELVNDLERCKESTAKSAAKPAAGLVQPKKVGGGAGVAASSTPVRKAEPKPAVRPPVPAVKVTAPAPLAVPAPATAASSTQPAARAAAASAGATVRSSSGFELETFETPAPAPSSADGIPSAYTTEVERMSSTATEEPEVQTPKIAVDPMMDEGRPSSGAARSFSEIDELPPLKEIRVALTAADKPEPEVAHRAVVFEKIELEKPRIQPREVAKKAVTEIKKTPPQLFLYSIAAAVVVILIIIGAIAYHIHSLNADEDTPPTESAATSTPAAEAGGNPVQPQSAASTAGQNAAPPQVIPEPPAEQAVPVEVKPKYAPGKKRSKTSAPVAPAIVPGQLNVSSSPAGAQIQVDGQSNPAWVTPYDLSGLQPGQHAIAVSKPGFASEARTIEVASGSKSFLSVQLAPLTATVSMTSDPAGAEVWMDGKDTGKTTPVQVSVDKAGNHSFSFKKQGYLDESAQANLQIGQASHLTATLKVLGSADDVRIGGKFKKMFGGSDTTGMGSVAVKTQPKGAQIAINNRVLDKLSPVEFYLDPGNYVVDITLSGFKSVRRVIAVDKSGKVVISESLDRE